jgi:hypothetical protein
MVSVAVPADALSMFTGEVVPKLRVGRSTAPVGELWMVAVSVTFPVNPPPGVTVMVEVFPVAAPGATVTAVPASVKPGGTAVTEM